MSSSRPPPLPQAGTSVLSYLQTLVKYLRKTRIRPGAGIAITETEAGTTISVATNGGGASNRHPFKVTRNDDGATKQVSVRPGTINSLVPSDIFEPIEITGSGTEYIVLTMTVTGNSPVSSSLSKETTYPVPSLTTPTDTPTAVKDVIAVLQDGKVYQIRDTNLTATATEVFQETVTSPSPGERNYIPWYRWEVGVA